MSELEAIYLQEKYEVNGNPADVSEGRLMLNTGVNFIKVLHL